MKSIIFIYIYRVIKTKTLFMKKLLLVTFLLLSLRILGGTEVASLERSKQIFLEQQEVQKETNRRIGLIEALKYVESRSDPNAYNKVEQAVGILQIRPIMVREVNRLLGYNKYSLKDRWCPDKSVRIFIDLQNKIQGSTWNLEKAARVWNGGYGGMKKSATKHYWELVKKQINT